MVASAHTALAHLCSRFPVAGVRQRSRRRAPLLSRLREHSIWYPSRKPDQVGMAVGSLPISSFLHPIRMSTACENTLGLTSTSRIGSWWFVNRRRRLLRIRDREIGSLVPKICPHSRHPAPAADLYRDEACVGVVHPLTWFVLLGKYFALGAGLEPSERLHEHTAARPPERPTHHIPLQLRLTWQRKCLRKARGSEA
jgi:hypothetical protein